MIKQNLPNTRSSIKKKRFFGLLTAKKGLPVLGVLLLSGVALGAFVGFYQSSPFEVIINGESAEIVFGDSLGQQVISGANATTRTGTVYWDNANGETNLTFSMDVNITADTSVVCDNTGDVEVQAIWNNQTLTDDEMFLIPSGVGNLEISVSTVKKACPQNVTVIVGLQEQLV